MIDRLAKSAYVSGTRVVRAGLRGTGLMSRLDRAQSRRGQRHQHAPALEPRGLGAASVTSVEFGHVG